MIFPQNRMQVTLMISCSAIPQNPLARDAEGKQITFPAIVSAM
jgi:hypothetical protein